MEIKRLESYGYIKICININLKKLFPKYNDMINYIIFKDTIIFKYDFDNNLINYSDLFSKYNKLIFFEYDFSLELLENYMINDFNFKYIYKYQNLEFSCDPLIGNTKSKFNCPIDFLELSTLTHIYFLNKFNQSIDKLPQTMIFLIY